MISPKLILPTLAVIFVMLPILNSCSTTKIAALPCPEPVNNNHLKKANKKHPDYKYLARHKPISNKKNSSLSATRQGKKPASVTSHTNAYNNGEIAFTERQYTEAPEFIEAQSGPYVDSDYNLAGIEKINVLTVTTGQNYTDKTVSAANPADCDTILLKTGKMILGKVAEIGTYEVRYRRCDNLDGPVIVVRKAELAEIRYQNGSKEYFTDTDQKVNQMPYPPAFSPVVDQRKVEGLGLAGFVASLVGLFVAGIPLGIIAVIFGLVSLSKIKKQPGRYKGRGFAIASFIIGLVDIVAMIILLAVAA